MTEQAILAMAEWLANEDGDAEDFKTNAGGVRDYHMERARNLALVADPYNRVEINMGGGGFIYNNSYYTNGQSFRIDGFTFEIE